MPIQYIPYYPEPIQGQALLNNFTRAQRALKYRDNDKVFTRILRGMPLYEMESVETVGKNPNGNLVIRGECVSACAYLKQQNIKVDLVYIDPPFASGADYAKKIYLRRNPKVAQAIEQAEQEMDNDELRGFEEKMYGDIWNKEAYLNWMYENLHAIKSVMSETGSIYVHLDWHIGHYVKVLMDEIFGEELFSSQIIWQRVTGHMDTEGFGFNHDMILVYAIGENYTWNTQFAPYDKQYLETHYLYKDEDGRRYELDQISAAGQGEARVFFGKLLEPPSGTHWRYSQANIDKLTAAGKIVMTSGGRPRIKSYLDERKGKQVQSIWTDIHPVNSQAKEDTGYGTQKPEALLKRIVEASSNEGMTVADFFGGSGVTAKVAYDLGRTFIHADVGINSIQTTRDRLKTAKASFEILEINDGIALFRNPAQTMDKLKSLIKGLGTTSVANKNRAEIKTTPRQGKQTLSFGGALAAAEEKGIYQIDDVDANGLSRFWAGGIHDSKKGLIPVFLPNLLDHTQKILDKPLLNRILNEALPELPDDVNQVIVYFVDLEDRKEIQRFIQEYNPTEIKVELRDLKEVLHEIVTNDEVEYKASKGKEGTTIEFTRFYSDRLAQKIDAYNQKRELNKKQIELDEVNDDEESEKGTAFKPIKVSKNGLELIELVSLDCTSAKGKWNSDKEIKIDKKGFVIRDGEKTKEFWNGKITSKDKPLRLKVRNIAGDETIVVL